MDKVKSYQPQYYKNFTCTGSECKYNCCRFGWRIDIDKSTYDKYMALDEEIKKDIIENLEPVDGGKKGARPVLDSNGDCNFLNERGLCSLQLKLGFQYLSEVCWYYPRIFCQVGGSLERFLELSCEEAAKLILFDKGYMNFEELDLEPDPYNPGELKFNFHMNTDKYTKSPNAINIFWKLRVTTVAILQSRQYKVRFRMLILCLFMQEINDLFAAGRDEEVPFCADDYMKRLDNNYYNELAAEMPYGAERDFKVILDILKDMYSSRVASLVNIVNQALNGFDIKADGKLVNQNITDNFSKYYEMYFADKEYIFENYLLHRVLSEGFPFNYRGEADVINNYVDLLAKFNLIEFLFVGICRSCMKFDKRRIIDCISIFTRSYEHSSTKFLKTSEFKSK